MTDEILAAAYEWRKLRVRFNRIFGKLPVGHFGKDRWNEMASGMDQAIEWTERDAVQADRFAAEKDP